VNAGCCRSRDEHQPVVVFSITLDNVALRQPNAILGTVIRTPQRIYAFDNGPGHTIGFEPNTFVDVTPDWSAAIEWLGRLMSFVRNVPYDPRVLDAAQNVKETLARYRGLASGVKYAEAVWATGAYPQELL